jgi:Cysteine-rich CPXCG
MKRKPSSKPKQSIDVTAQEAQDIDALYGLEPVFEPGVSTGELVQAAIISCPYCGENFETTVDVSSGSCAYVEDCQVCCQPIEVSIDVTDDGELEAIHARRQD